MLLKGLQYVVSSVSGQQSLSCVYLGLVASGCAPGGDKLFKSDKKVVS